MTIRCVAAVVAACALAESAGVALAQSTFEATQPTAKVAPAASTSVSPDARQFLVPSTFAYWAGTERTMTGELSLATPRAWLDGSLLPALDEHLSTTGYARYGHSGLFGRGVGPDWNLMEIAFVHDVKGGPVLGMNFRTDVRQDTMLQWVGTLVYPLKHFVVVPTIEVGYGSDTAPLTAGAIEVRSDPQAARDYSLAVDASDWTYGRARVLGRLGTLQRVSRVVAVEGHVGAGAWAGPLMGGDFALEIVAAALQAPYERFAFYERATFARGAAYQIGAALPDGAAYSFDLAAGLEWKAAKTYGIVLGADGGGQSLYKRWGVEITAYGSLL